MLVPFIQKQLLFESAFALQHPKSANHKTVIPKHNVNFVHIGFMSDFKHDIVDFLPSEFDNFLLLNHF